METSQLLAILSLLEKVTDDVNGQEKTGQFTALGNNFISNYVEIAQARNWLETELSKRTS